MRSNNYTSYIFNPMYNCNVLLKTLPCHPAERLWAQEPSFQCGREKARICTFFVLGAYAFCALLSARSLLASRSRARKRKRGPAPTSAKHSFSQGSSSAILYGQLISCRVSALAGNPDQERYLANLKILYCMAVPSSY
jgi:hypothetical protein